MSRSRPSVPAVLLLLLLLSLRAPAVRSDCDRPPEVPNAQPALEGHTTFPEQSTVTYKCNEGFVKVPNKTNTVICLSSNQWSELEEFCNRSCDVPPGLLFASLRKTYTQQNYFPVGSTVDYECRPGYRRDPSLSGTLTCLQNLEWSKPDEFCKKKSCPNPGEIKNGIINITTDILFGSAISFSCNTGYKLVGADSSYCFLMGKTVGWSEPLPTCVEIFCPEPPQIENGRIREESDTYKYRQTVTYECSKGLTLVGSSSIFCDVKGEQGEWSGSPPECKGKSPATKPPPTVQKPTTVKVPGTKVPPTPQKPTMVKVPATQHTPVSRTSVGIHVTRTSNKGKENAAKDAANFLYGKFGFQTVKRNCYHCGMYNPYSWKRILSFNCLRKTIKMQCLWVPKRKRVNALYQHVLWTPSGHTWVTLTVLFVTLVVIG
uniref:Complement decay-accelerating factor isoform X2 n=1 Tax=Castor canadensis TaxID=51338 RepID=A0A8C0XTB4_CASCN|nr:complement decay-accelerating factor isoform X2 [Castor canadensis]